MTKAFQLTTFLVISLSILMSCNSKNTSNATENSKTIFNLEEAKKEVQKSIVGFSAELAKGDSKSAAAFYAKEAVFMPNNAPIVIGRDSIASTLAGFINAGFTKLNVETTWADGCGDYLLETEKWTLSNGKNTITGKSLVIWKKEDGIWKMYKDIINTDAP